MTPVDLANLRPDQVAELRQFFDLKIPEGESLDYKTDLSSDYHTTVAAMANTSGGVVVAGVSEDPASKTPIDTGGFAGPKDPLGQITSQLWTYLDPVPSTKTALIDGDGGKRYVVISVQPSVDRTVLHREAGIRVRVGDQSRFPTRSDFDRLLAREASRSNRVAEISTDQQSVVRENAQPGGSQDPLSVYLDSRPIRPTEIMLDDVLDLSFEAAAQQLLLPHWSRTTQGRSDRACPGTGQNIHHSRW